jgi:N-acyl-D-amino-acid deacylase
VIFDPATVADESTWTDPFRPASGVAQVIVNGVTVMEVGEPTGELPGRVIGKR